MIKMIGAAAMLPRKSPERPNTPLDIPGLAVLSRCTDVEVVLSESMVTEFEDQTMDLVTIKTLYDILRAKWGVAVRTLTGHQESSYGPLSSITIVSRIRTIKILP